MHIVIYIVKYNVIHMAKYIVVVIKGDYTKHYIQPPAQREIKLELKFCTTAQYLCIVGKQIKEKITNDAPSKTFNNFTDTVVSCSTNKGSHLKKDNRRTLILIRGLYIAYIAYKCTVHIVIEYIVYIGNNYIVYFVYIATKYILYIVSTYIVYIVTEHIVYIGTKHIAYIVSKYIVSIVYIGTK